jgi:hypothetical protein
MDHVFCYAPLPAPKQPVTAWTVFHTETLSDDTNVLPPMLPYAFSGSGLKFATLVPQVNLQEPFQWTDADGYLHGDPGWLVLDEYLILRGTFAPTAEGVTLQTISRTAQHCTFGHDSGGDVTGDPWDLTWTSWSTAFHRSSAVVALDFQGEEEVTVSGTLAYDYASRAIHQYTYILSEAEIKFFPAEDDRGGIHFSDTLKDAFFEFRDRGHANLSQEGAGHF